MNICSLDLAVAVWMKEGNSLALFANCITANGCKGIAITPLVTVE